MLDSAKDKKWTCVAKNSWIWQESGFTSTSKIANFDNLLYVDLLTLAIYLGLLLLTLKTGQISFTLLMRLSIENWQILEG